MPVLRSGEAVGLITSVCVLVPSIVRVSCDSPSPNAPDTSNCYQGEPVLAHAGIAIHHGASSGQNLTPPYYLQ
jgi:hypothetical protein